MKRTPHILSVQVMRRPSDTIRNERVICEEPLTIRVEGKPLMVTMRTPGNDVELVTGLLFSEGIIADADDIQAIAHVSPPDEPQNSIDTRLASGTQATSAIIQAAQRDMITTSACGVCGTHSIDRLFAYATPIPTRRDVPATVITAAFAEMADQQTMFDETGGSHAAALATLDGQVLIVREDIGRHNAIDKVIGCALRQDKTMLTNAILLTSGRAAFDTLQKAFVAGIPVVVARGAASSLAISLASRANIALYGFFTHSGYNSYTHQDGPHE